MSIPTGTLVKLERGLHAPSSPQIRGLLRLYLVQDRSLLEFLLELSAEAAKPSWSSNYDDLLTPDEQILVDLESGARNIRCFEPTLVPDLLQTADYMRAHLRATREWLTDEAIVRLVEVGKLRQQALHHTTTCQVVCVLDESVLHRVIGSRGITLEQLRALVQAASLPNFELRVLPFSAARKPGSMPTELLSFGRGLDDVAANHSPGSLTMLDNHEDVSRLQQEYSHIYASSLTPDASLSLIVDLVT